MSKVAIIGIDGLDPLLLEEWKKFLPNFRRLFDDNFNIKIESTVPPDSICAWTTIFTGENPAEHGLIESIDYLSAKKSIEDTDRSASFKGKTFWDIAGRNGKKVCVINPFLAYPAWEVNGVMVSGPVFEGGSISTYPDSIRTTYKFPPLGGIVDFPDEKELGGFLRHTLDMTEQLAHVSVELYKDHNPDLFFVTFLTLDRILHFLWRFTDENDPYYPGENSLKHVVKDAYMVYDKIVGTFRDTMSGDTTLVVLSDHGHRRRCSKCLNLNEVLKNMGYLKTSGKGIKGQLKKFVEITKVFTIATLSKYDLQDWIYRIAKFIPNRKALKKSTYLIDDENSSVKLSNLCGTNPHGGIDIRAKPDEYESLRDNIIDLLMGMNRTYKKDIVKWAKKREMIYSGKYEERLPDILFELDEEYGVGMDMFTSVITPNYTHKKISGGHKKEATLLVHSDNNNIRNMERPDSLAGLKDYILKVIEVKY